MSNNLSQYIGLPVVTVENLISNLVSEELLTVADVLYPADTLQDCIIVGYLTSIPMSSSLSGTMACSNAGASEAVVIGTHVILTVGDGRLTYTYPTNSDTYDDLDFNGNIHHNSVANSATPPSISTNSIRLQKVVTNGSTITAVQTAGYLYTSGSVVTNTMAGFTPCFATLNTPQINQLLNATPSPQGAVQNQGPLSAPSDQFIDQLITGMVPVSIPPTGSLIFTFEGNGNGQTILICQGNRIVISNNDARLTASYTANQDTYIDVDGGGNFHYTAVANNATPPSVYANSTRVVKVITNGSGIASYLILLNPYVVPNALGALTQIPHLAGSYTAPQNHGPIADPADFTQDSIIAGFQTAVPGSNNLTSTMSSSSGGFAIAFVNGNRVAIPTNDTRLTFTYTVNKDTYNDLDIYGNVSHTAVANGASAPSLATNSIRLEKVVTNGVTITSTQNYGTFTNTGGSSSLGASGFNTSLPVLAPGQINQILKSSILPNTPIQNQGPLASPSDYFADHLVTGFVTPSLPTVGLSCTFTGNANGTTVLVTFGNRICILNGDARLTNTYTASRDTYIDVDNTGAFHYTAVLNGNAAPNVTTNSMRLAKVVSGPSTVTAVTILASLYPLPIGMPLYNDGRAYLATQSPYQDGSSSGNSTLYFGPTFYTGNKISVWSSILNKWVTHTFAEISIALTGLTTGTLYDFYGYWDEPTQTLKFDPTFVAWSGGAPVGRGALDGKVVKASDHTRLLLGFFKAASATTTLSWVGSRWLYSQYNQAQLLLRAVDLTTFWAYSSAIWREAHGLSIDGISRFSFVVSPNSPGQIQITNFQTISAPSNANVAGFSGIGVDSSNPSSYAGWVLVGYAGSNGSESSVSCQYSQIMTPGYHYITRVEYVAEGSPDFYGNGPSGMFAQIWC
jgi:hypothetical protein